MRDQLRAMAPVLLAVTAVGAFLGHRSLAADQLRVRAANAADPQATQRGKGESAQPNEVSPRAGHRKFIQTFLIRIGGNNLNPGDEAQMAKYDVVFANKWHYGDIKGNTWKAIKAINPDTQIYLYVAAKSTVERDDAKPAMHLTNLGRYHNARGHSMGSLHGENPDLFLRDRSGERIMTNMTASTSAEQRQSIASPRVMA